MTSLYEAVFYAWANQQAALLRAGKLSAADIANIAEKIESIGKSEKRQLVSRLTVLLLHLLKWRFQPGLRGNSWRYTIKVRRRDLARHLGDNPSLSAQLTAVVADAYASAVLLAAGETGLPEATFPAECPWSYQHAAIPTLGRNPPTDAPRPVTMTADRANDLVDLAQPLHAPRAPGRPGSCRPNASATKQETL